MKHDDSYYKLLEEVICKTLLSVVEVETDTMKVEFIIASKLNEELRVIARDFNLISKYSQEYLLHPSDKTLFEELMRQDKLDTMYANGEDYTYEFRSKLTPDDISYRWIRVRILTLEKKPKGYHILASFEDISDLKEKELRQERIKNYRMMALKNAFEELYIIDPIKNEYSAINVNAINEQNHPDGAFCYEDFINVIKRHVHPDDRESCLELMAGEHMLQRFQQGEQVYSLDYRIHKQDTEDYRWMYAVIMQMQEEDGKYSAFMMIQDITEKKQADNLEIQYQVLQEQMDVQIQHYHYMEENEKEMRSFRHDLKNHLLILESLYDQGNIQDFKDYLENMRGYMLKEKEIVQTDYPIIDALLNEKIAYAQQENIKIDYHIRMERGLPLTAMDTCILLGNSLDNAIEACQGMEESDQPRTIELKLVYAHNTLIINVINSVNQQKLSKDKRFSTTKENRKLHGFGISNMKRVVESYDGTFELYQADHEVILKISLYF